MSKIITQETKEKIVAFYQSKPMTLDAVANEFQISTPTVSKILKEFNVPLYKKAMISNPNLKEHFFENIDSEDKAYFLGLIISDGNVFKEENSTANRQASISITLDLNDEYMLLKFKDSLNSSTNIGHDGRGCGQLAVRSDIMAQDLEKYGITPRKTQFTYLPTNIHNNMMPHLIRGIFDGDGSIQAKKNNNSNRFLRAISFCGTHKLMQDISDYLTNTLNLNQSPNVYDYNNKPLSEIKIQNIHDISLVGDWMYNNATIYLLRKKQIYDNFKLHYNLQDNAEVTE